MFVNALNRFHMLYILVVFTISQPPTITPILPFSPSWASLGFAWRMHVWVSWINTHYSTTALIIFLRSLLLASSWLNTPSLFLFLCLCAYIHLVSFCFTMSSLPVLGPPTCHPSLTFLSLCPAPMWLRCFRWHPKTYSGILATSEHDFKQPAAPPQVGFWWSGFVTCQSCWE